MRNSLATHESHNVQKENKIHFEMRKWRGNEQGMRLGRKKRHERDAR